MVDASVDSLRGELALLAATFVLTGLGPNVDQAIRVACDLLVRDMDTPATVAVAGFAYGATLSDAGPVIRDMLREQGFPAPEPGASEAEEVRAVLRAVAGGALGICEFSGFFVRQVPAWEQQEERQRRLVALLHDWDWARTPEARSATAAAVRQAARDVMGDATCET